MDTPVIVILIVAIVILGGGAAFFLLRRDTDRDALDHPTPPPTQIPTTPAPVVETQPLPPVEVTDDDQLVDDTITEPDVTPGVVETPDIEPEPVVEAEPEPVVEARPSFRERLSRARSVFTDYVGSMLSRSDITEETWEELEEALIRADVGIMTAQELLERVRATVKEQGLQTPEELIEAVKADMKTALTVDRELKFSNESPTIWLFVGVNGVGKTTTIGKVGRRLTDEGKSVVMAAGDTFRAAAAEQLEMWADRCGADLIRGAEGGDPSSVIFDAVASASSKGTDIVLADTAGRLHTKTNLMDELSKVRRVADKGAGSVTEVFLVIDATTGQNGLTQAKQFAEATDVTGVVLTKLDGSAKGGIVFAIQSELGIPVKLVGLGEQASDLVDFDPDEFVDALFDQASGNS